MHQHLRLPPVVLTPLPTLRILIWFIVMQAGEALIGRMATYRASCLLVSITSWMITVASDSMVSLLRYPCSKLRSKPWEDCLTMTTARPPKQPQPNHRHPFFLYFRLTIPPSGQNYKPNTTLFLLRVDAAGQSSVAMAAQLPVLRGPF